MNNLYFIINLPEQALDAIFKHVVQSVETARKSLDGKKTLVKLPVELSQKIQNGEAEIPAPLKNKTMYTHSEIKSILATSEWTPEEDI